MNKSVEGEVTIVCLSSSVGIVIQLVMNTTTVDVGRMIYMAYLGTSFGAKPALHIKVRMLFALTLLPPLQGMPRPIIVLLDTSLAVDIALPTLLLEDGL